MKEHYFDSSIIHMKVSKRTISRLSIYQFYLHNFVGIKFVTRSIIYKNKNKNKRERTIRLVYYYFFRKAS
jgi:hypothetical protein